MNQNININVMYQVNNVSVGYVPQMFVNNYFIQMMMQMQMMQMQMMQMLQRMSVFVLNFNGGSSSGNVPIAFEKCIFLYLK